MIYLNYLFKLFINSAKEIKNTYTKAVTIGTVCIVTIQQFVSIFFKAKQNVYT